MNADEKELLLQAQQYIQQRKFADARFYLTQIPNNTTAKKWLAKLDQVAPTTPTPAPDRLSSMLEDGLRIPVSAPMDGDKILNPWNPDTFYVSILFFMPAALLIYSWNWKRFGKGGWGLETFLIGVLALVAGSAALILAATMDAFRSPIVLGVAVAVIFSTHVWIFVTAWAQRRAYQKWLPTRDPDILRQYNHKPGQMLLIWAGASLLLVFGFAGFMAYSQRTLSYDDSAVSVTYSALWSSQPPSDSYFCQTNYVGCFLYMTRGSTSLSFSSYPIDYDTTPRGFVEDFWGQYVEDNPGIVKTTSGESDVTGAHMMQYEFWYPGDDNSMIYGWWIFLLPPDTDIAYGIHAWSFSKDTMDGARDDILEITNSVIFKTPTF